MSGFLREVGAASWAAGCRPLLRVRLVSAFLVRGGLVRPALRGGGVASVMLSIQKRNLSRPFSRVSFPSSFPRCPTSKAACGLVSTKPQPQQPLDRLFANSPGGLAAMFYVCFFIILSRVSRLGSYGSLWVLSWSRGPGNTGRRCQLPERSYSFVSGLSVHVS